MTTAGLNGTRRKDEAVRAQRSEAGEEVTDKEPIAAAVAVRGAVGAAKLISRRLRCTA